MERVFPGDWQNSGVHIDGASADVFITDSIINGGTAPGAGLRLTNKVEALCVSNVDIIGGGASVVASASGAMTPSLRLIPQFNKFTNCYFDSSTAGVVLDKTNLITFANCWFASSAASSGVTIEQCWETKFVGCEFFNNWVNGAILNNSLQRNTRFLGCGFHNNNAGAGAGSGLLVGNNVTDWFVDHSAFNNAVYATPTQSYGLYIGTGTDRFTVTDCNFGAHPTAKLSDNSSAGVEKHIARNIGFKTQAQGSVVAAGGVTSVFFNHGLAVTPALEDVMVVPQADPGTRYWVGAVNSTQIGIGFQAALGGPVTFGWQARCKGS